MVKAGKIVAIKEIMIDLDANTKNKINIHESMQI